MSDFNPYQAPQSVPQNWQSPLGAPGVLTPTRMDANKVLNDAWEIYKPNLGQGVLCFFIMWIANFVIGLPQNAINMIIQSGRADRDQVVLLLAVAYSFQFLGFFFQTWLNLGMMRFMLSLAKGEPANFGMLFSTDLTRFLNAIGANILFGIATMFASLLCILPGVALALFIRGQAENPLFWIGIVLGFLVCMLPAIYVALSFWMCQILIVDRNLGPIACLQESWRFSEGNRWQVLLLGIIGCVLFILGACACGIGVLFTAPLVILMFPTAYLACTGQPNAIDRARMAAYGAQPWQKPM